MSVLSSLVASTAVSSSDGGVVPVDEAVSITMEGSCVSIGLPRWVDDVRTHVMVDAVNAAVGAGSVVQLGSIGAPAPVSAPIGSSFTGDGSTTPSVEVLRPGLIVVRRSAVVWMIDVSEQRFLQSDELLDVRFVPAASWRRYRALWISAAAISALTPEGAYVTSSRSSCGGATTDARGGVAGTDRVAS